MHYCQRYAIFIFPVGKMGAVWQHSFAKRKSVYRIALQICAPIADVNFSSRDLFDFRVFLFITIVVVAIRIYYYPTLPPMATQF